MDNFVADAIFIDAKPERVFAALLEPEEMLEWLDGTEVEVTPTAGGRFAVQRSDGSRVEGRIETLEAPYRLTLTDYRWTGADAVDGHEPNGGGSNAGDTGERGPMRVELILKDHDGGVWITVRQLDLDGQPGWETFATATRREWVRATVALKRHIEQI